MSLILDIKVHANAKALFIDSYFGYIYRDCDVISEAISFDLSAADVFGSGRLPPTTAGPIFWPATFELQLAETETPATRIER